MSDQNSAYPYEGLTAEQVAKIRAAVAAEPPLTAEQREDLAALFSASA